MTLAPSNQQLLQNLESEDLAVLASQIRDICDTPGFKFLRGMWENERLRSHDRVEAGTLRGEAAYAAEGGFARGLKEASRAHELVLAEARRAERSVADAAERGEEDPNG